jgi:4-hydroxythreonine-4-phosphate dehydrogenase
MKPVVAITPGDPTGVGPEITARLLAEAPVTDWCVPVIVADARVFAQGMRIAKVSVPVARIPSPKEALEEGVIYLWDVPATDPAGYALGKPDAKAAGAACELMFACLDAMQAGTFAGMTFGPLHKQAMREAGYDFRDEHAMFAHHLGWQGQCDAVNMLDAVIATRVTSHVPFREVPDLLSKDSILATIRLANTLLTNAGATSPRIAVSALNPHGGENGGCGREEIDVIKPAIDAARAEGIDATGPLPADTICVQVFARKRFDGIVSMFHDQAQTGIKLIASQRSITITGGLPFPVTTTSHGTAHDIAGQGVAATTSLEQAVKVMARMAAAK